MPFKVDRNTIKYYIGVLAILATLGISSYRSADAGPSNGPITYRAAAVDGDGHVVNAVLLAQGNRTMANTTPVNGSTVCLDGDVSQFAAELTLSGTLSGTNPTLDVILQGSYDKTHWFTVHSYAQINATVTPAGAAERAQFSDVAASTAITRPICYRTRSTFGGTGTVTGNYGASIFGK